MPDIAIKPEDSREPRGGQRHPSRGCLRIATKHSRELREESPAPDLAVIFAKEIWRLHGLPSDIVSDRDSCFTSPIGKELTNHLGTKRSMSIAFHPQTDDHTERINATLTRINKTIGPNFPARRACLQHRRFRDNQPVLRELQLPTRDAVDPTSSVGGEFHQPREQVASSTLES
jgi:hypothetical protein